MKRLLLLGSGMVLVGLLTGCSPKETASAPAPPTAANGAPGAPGAAAAPTTAASQNGGAAFDPNGKPLAGAPK